MIFEIFVLFYSISFIPICVWYTGYILKIVNVKFPEYNSSFNKPLESLRGIACAAVLMAHINMYFYSWNNSYALKEFSSSFKSSSYLGQSGVVWFFMLTGYLFWNMVQSNSFDMNNFYIKRIRRLVPVMIVLVLVVSIFDWVMGGTPIPNLEQLVKLLKNFSFYFAGIHDTFYPEIVHRINNLWTLRWEWMFYLVLPLISTLCRSWLALTILFFPSIFILTDVYYTGVKQSDAALFLAFYLGMVFVHFIKFIKVTNFLKLKKIILLSLSPYGFLFVILLSMTSMFMPASEIRPQNIYFIFINAPVFLWFLLYSVFDNDRMKWILSLPCLNLGRISYSLYLWHLFITFIVYKLFINIPFINNFFSLIFLYPVVVILVSIPISILSYKLIELRFMYKHMK
ncbi:acyltransferase [Aggregatibacter actinomycetemcomitans]|uniref:acyltransferase family protein n=1 Tax=Aggregatibacter actinomycetemcomitans TaxID=714 RepID=UPI0011DAE331|nr:acyltransferase [Aggregatibacter actinomycetemcomitans]QEH44499.1 acyltransferase [Aggregatibacter actinomycetemcomitans]QEH48571.1 acyltransferase [Aggregatibacter actinomycetemcomitans]TYA51896.1 acyltransferase [Aggregatibacter actinomycetemcomitans]TYB29994.1 acyltransferase [Aggregatibacter actinomycetemcomitans]